MAHMNDRHMLATASTGTTGRREQDVEDLVRKGWILDLKMDGIRAWLHIKGGVVTLTNRNGVDITTRFPEIVTSLSANFIRQGDLWLDGEIVADDGRFETTLTRDKQGGSGNGPADRPCTFWAFDVPDFSQACYRDRRTTLEQMAQSFTGRIRITPVGDTMAWFKRTRELGLEGVIAKDPNAVYQFGSRSKSWVKFKNLHRVSAVVVGYTPGEGARSHFGAMELAMIDPSKTGADAIVRVGRVGTGFTEKQGWDLKAAIDGGNLLIAEIETLNRTKDNQLRFPVFKGIRTDITPANCTIDQLEELPLC